MKVKNLNASSKRTREAIKNEFIQLLCEKKNIDAITVTELTKRIGITRSTFYTHYESIYEIVNEIENDITELILSGENINVTIEDIDNYIDKIKNHIVENEAIYRIIFGADFSLYYIEKIKKKFVNGACNAIKEIYHEDDLELKMIFFIDGVFCQLINYLRKNEYYTSEELSSCIKKWFRELFL